MHRFNENELMSALNNHIFAHYVYERLEIKDAFKAGMTVNLGSVITGFPRSLL